MERRNGELSERISTLHITRNEQEILHQDKISEVSFDLVKTTLKEFNAIITTDKSKQKQKMLLHMIIPEITINEKERWIA